VIPAPFSSGLVLRRTAGRLGVLLVCLVLLGLLGLVGYAALSWVVSSTAAFRGGACGGTTTSTTPLVTAGEAAVSDEQRTNAAVIVGVGKEMQVPDRGLWIALATAMQESTLRNLNYGDRDSLGLFQQRPSQGWGTPAQVTDPRYAAQQFYERLLQVPGWTSMPLWKAAQAVQRSGFPTAYSKWEGLAAQLLVDVGDGISLAATDVCRNAGPGGGPTPAPWTGGATGCAMDDPTTGGCVTGATLHALQAVDAAFGGYRAGSLILSTGCWSPHPWNPASDHPKGRGCDFFPGHAGRFAQGNQLEAGWQLAHWFRTHADALRVSYIIWQGRIWTTGGGDTAGGWGRPYGGGGVYDPDEATGGHFDHLHVSFRL
jgi:hypothetical protein